MLDLRDKVAIVTGASRGIGREVALMLAARGARVVAAARGDHAAETVSAIGAAGGRAEAARSTSPTRPRWTRSSPASSSATAASTSW